jgi:hypothetical protein
MMMLCDTRELLTGSVIKGARVWGLTETLASTEAVKEITKLGDQATFMNALGLSPTEDSEWLQRFASFLSSDEAVQALRNEGERWQVSSILSAAGEILPQLASSLAKDSNPGRAGCLLRAVPIIAGSRSSELARQFGQTLGVEPVPETLITAYSKAFCNRDETILAAIDRIIVYDRVLGPVAVELSARLLQELGYDGYNLDQKSRESLIDCLALLVRSALEKVEPSRIVNLE